jgi:hypothetical protein
MRTGKFDGITAEELFELCKKSDIGLMTIRSFNSYFIPNLGRNNTDLLVKDFIAGLKKYGKKNLYQALLLWVVKNPSVYTALFGFDEPRGVVRDFEDCIGGKLTSFHIDLHKRYGTLTTRDCCRRYETQVKTCQEDIPVHDIQGNRI